MKKFALSLIVFCSALTAYPYCCYEQVVVTRPSYQTQTMGFGFEKVRKSSRYGFSFSVSERVPTYRTDVYDVYHCPPPPPPCTVYHYYPCCW